MLRLHAIDALRTIPGPVHLAIGFFDGVHTGHQEVIRHAMARAAEDGGRSVVLTFDPHPMQLLRPDRAPLLLTSAHHRSLLVERLGAGAFLVVPFDREFAAQSPDAFLRALTAAAQVRSVTVGRDWAFGQGRAGNVETLTALGRELGFAVQGISPVLMDGEPVSSTRVRLAVEAGDFSAASRLLGHEFAVLGTVSEGRQLGRTIGFPTANLRLENTQLPPIGVYAVRTWIGDRLVNGVANLGMRPTVESAAAAKAFEVHLFDFSGDLYGQELEVRFAGRLRDEQKFASLDDLKAQIARDAAAARRLLEG